MKKLVVLSGAGMSAESGISTFRDSGGLWENYPVEQVATPEGFYRNPALVLDFYNARRKELIGAKPNEGHKLVAELEKHFDVTVITQNVDNLHERAGSTNVIHLHGELMKACSSRNPDDRKSIVELPEHNPVIKIGDKAKDGSQLRPFIVWFGEAVPMFEAAVKKTEKADIFVIIGTSLNVYPAAGLVNYLPQTSPVYLIDPKDVDVKSVHNVTFIKKGASEGMKELMSLLIK